MFGSPSSCLPSAYYITLLLGLSASTLHLLYSTALTGLPLVNSTSALSLELGSVPVYMCVTFFSAFWKIMNAAFSYHLLCLLLSQDKFVSWQFDVVLDNLSRGLLWTHIHPVSLLVSLRIVLLCSIYAQSFVSKFCISYYLIDIM